MNTDLTVMLPLRRMWQRVETSAGESDVAYFYELLHLGELMTKLVVASFVASIDDREGNRYKLEHDLIRADGLGAWVTNLDEALVGPSSNVMNREAQPLAQEITQKWTKRDDVWQRQVAEYLDDIVQMIDGDSPDLPSAVSLRWWFSTFVWLRNRTRGHGSTLPGTCANTVTPLAQSLHILTDNLAVLTTPCAAIRRNLSGKYRVVPITQLDTNFEQLKSDSAYSHADGVYFSFEDLSYTPLCIADIDLTDVYCANGNYVTSSDGGTYEVHSYVTDNRDRIDGSRYLNAVAQLRDSETHGYPDLDAIGETFTNLPPQTNEYVTRGKLEQELLTVLEDDRHPVVSLVGRGGIGKTSLTLEVLHQLCHSDRYELILWLSARDIDLLSEGPKDVRPQVLTFEDIANEFVKLLRPYGLDRDDMQSSEYIASVLSGRTEAGPTLLAVDNFETVRSPGAIYQTLSTHIRVPNKILITSRHREFKADYPVDVAGMTRLEYDQLVEVHASRLRISSLLNPRYLTELYEKSEGHPYVVKVMLGEVATKQRAEKVRRVVARKDRMLDALFERSYATLPPGAKRAFLTLCNWRSVVTQLELEAALMRPDNDYFDAAEAVNSLKQHSMVEVLDTEDESTFLSVPEAARIFGKKKLSVSHMKPAIDVDTEMLRTFGAVRSGEIKNGLASRVDRITRNIATLAARGENISEYIGMLEYIATGYPMAWIKIAELRLERLDKGDAAGALDSVERYLQEAPGDVSAWRHLARIARETRRPDHEMNALYHLANLPNAPLADVSNAAASLSHHLAIGSMNVGAEEKRLMASHLAQMMEAQIDKAHGTDLSRLAWLYLHLKRVEDARRCMRLGLEIDPGNRHLLGLEKRLGEAT